MLAILRSNPGKRRRYLVISIGSKVPFRSRRMSRATLPLSGARSSGGSRCADWRAGCAASEAFSARSSSRWTSICVLSPRSASALVSAARMQIWPKRSPAEPPSGRRPSRSRSGLIRGAHPRDVITSANKIQDRPRPCAPSSAERRSSPSPSCPRLCLRGSLGRKCRYQSEIVEIAYLRIEISGPNDEAAHRPCLIARLPSSAHP